MGSRLSTSLDNLGWKAPLEANNMLLKAGQARITNATAMGITT